MLFSPCVEKWTLRRLMVSSLRPSLYIEGVCSKTPLVPLDSYSLPFGLPPALSSSGGLEVSCCKSGFTVTASGSGSESSSLSSSGALEGECYASGFTDTASGSAYSSLSSIGALKEACCANISKKQ